MCSLRHHLSVVNSSHLIALSLVQRDLTAPTRCVQEMSHRGEGKAVLVTSQFSHNLSVSLSNHCSAKNLKLTQVEHACSPLEQLREKVKMPLKSLLDMGQEDGICESNVVRQFSMTLAVLFERKPSSKGAIRLQWLVGNPGGYEPTMEDIKAALIEAMSHMPHKKFMLTFKRGDKWCVPCEAGKNCVRGNEDFYHVLMTVNGLRKLRER